MSRRCLDHNVVEPCPYCFREFGKFESWRDRLEALEGLIFKYLECGTLGHRDLKSVNPDVPPKEIDTRKAIAVVRDVGIGDIVMLAPSIRALKEVNPQRPIIFVTKPENFDVLAGVDYLDGMLPITAFKPEDFYKVYDTCKAVESTTSGGTLPLEEFVSKPRVEVFAELLGVSNVPRRMSLEPHEGSKSRMNGFLKNCKHPIIGLAPTCRSPLRVIPPPFVQPLAEMLTEYGGTVVLLGKTESWNKELAQVRGKGIVNFIDRLAIRDMIAAMSLLDAVIVPNTGTLHVAGAQGVKVLAIEGNNDPETFVNVYPTAKALTLEPGELICSPCHDQRKTCGLKPKQFGADCMQRLTPERIYKAFRSFYNGKNIAFVRDISLEHIGGAEITDKAFIEVGRELGYNIRLFDKYTALERMYDIFDYDLMILSNCWLFSKEYLQIILKAAKKMPFVKVEHDHRSLDEVIYGKFSREEYVEPLFRNSVLNVFVSPEHCQNYEDVLGVTGTPIFPVIDTDLFRPVASVTRKKNSALLGVPRKANMKENVKGHAELREFMAANKHLKFDVLEKIIPFDKMPEKYSAYEYFVHLPLVKWSCERVIFEAALCGCKVVTNANAQGVSWGRDLSDMEGLRQWIKKNRTHFWDEIEFVMGWNKKGVVHEISGDRGDGLRRMPSGQVASAKWA